MDEAWRTRLRLVVERPGDGAVLTVDGRLPEVEIPGRVWYASAPAVVAAFAPAGIDPLLLRLLDGGRDEADHLLSATLLAGLRGDEPQDAVWADRDEVADAAALLASTAGTRQPWAEPGWFPGAEAWLQSTVDATGSAVTGPVEQHKVWELSCVLRAPTTRGDVYLKATVDSPLFVAEAPVTALLAELFPEHVPAPLAVERERGWIATPDFGPEIGWEAPVPVREEALRQYAALQHVSVQHVDALLAAGCMDRRPAWLAAQLPAWFAEPTTGHWTSAEVSAALAAAIPRLVELCAELAGSPLPDTLLHGDMHMGNAAHRPGGGYLFFDWTDAGVGHPFVDMVAIAQEDDEASRDRLRDTYLAEWDHVTSRGELDRTWAVADVLAHANQAVSYMSLGLSLRGSEDTAPHPLFASYTSRWLRTVLGALDRLDGTTRTAEAR
jgi:hypothetical protein